MLRKIMIAMNCCMVAVCGVSGMDKMVENPIPEIIRAVSPTFLDETSFVHVASQFAKSLEMLNERYALAEKETDFPRKLSEHWGKKLDLLNRIKSSLVSSSQKESKLLWKEIVDVTNNGFYSTSLVAIQGTRNKTLFSETLDDFWQTLWQARELLTYNQLVQPGYVSLSEILPMCEKVDSSVQKMRIRNMIPERQIDDAIKIEQQMSSILNACEYMEYGQAHNTPKNIEQMKELFPSGALREVMLGVFQIVDGE